MRNNASIQRQLPEKIKKLRKKGYSYRDIETTLQCSKGTIAYHLGRGQKQKLKDRDNNYKKLFPRKLTEFIYCRTTRSAYKEVIPTKTSQFRKKCRGFQFNSILKKGEHFMEKPLTLMQYCQKVWPGIRFKKNYMGKRKVVPARAVCQWTGKPEKDDMGRALMYPFFRCMLSGKIKNFEYNDASCDHINGNRLDNRIENFGLTDLTYNSMKSNRTPKTFLKEIKQIVKHLEKHI